jgi:hypothetical protein
LSSSQDAPSPVALRPATEQVLKRSKTFLSVVQQAVSGEKSSEPTFVLKRREAGDAEKELQLAVRKLDRQRLALEERIDDTLRLLQRWESERLRALKTGKPHRVYSYSLLCLTSKKSFCSTKGH